MFSYKIDHLLDEDKSYQHLLDLLHDGALCCPQCSSIDKRVHSYQRSPVLTYQCKSCNKFYNIFSNTVFQGTHYVCSVIVMIIRGVSQGVSTSQLSQELDIDYSNLLKLRHQMQENAYENLPTDPIEDEVTESDEMFQNAGEKGRLHPGPSDPPRRRANKKKDMERTPMIDHP